MTNWAVLIPNINDWSHWQPPLSYPSPVKQTNPPQSIPIADARDARIHSRIHVRGPGHPRSSQGPLLCSCQKGLMSVSLQSRHNFIQICRLWAKASVHWSPDISIFYPRVLECLWDMSAEVRRKGMERNCQHQISSVDPILRTLVCGFLYHWGFVPSVEILRSTRE